MKGTLILKTTVGAELLSVKNGKIHLRHFFNDMQEGYTDDYTLERKDCNKGYNKENCCWIPSDHQSRNRTRHINNTTGFTGVSYHAGKRPVYVASWRDEGYTKTRAFYVNKYGDEMAKNLAVAFRETMVERLKDAGVYYGISHGAEKCDVQ